MLTRFRLWLAARLLPPSHTIVPASKLDNIRSLVGATETQMTRSGHFSNRFHAAKRVKLLLKATREEVGGTPAA